VGTVPLSDNVRWTILAEAHALSDTRGDLHFFRVDANEQLVRGGALAIGRNWRERIVARVARVYPQLGVPRFDRVWWGHVGITPTVRRMCTSSRPA
jgi:glycine/D-amino acid oxidase-like deaminating enzyme